MPTARDIAEQFVQHVNKHDPDALLELFATDAVLDAPRGIGTLNGRTAIRGFYSDLMFPSKPRVRAQHFIEAGSECVVELETRVDAEIDGAPAGVQHLAEVFELGDDGLIRRLAIYMR
jgi:limonene-1,2-epoxide hydrolase